MQPFKVQNWFDCGKKGDPYGVECDIVEEVRGLISKEHHFENTDHDTAGKHCCRVVI